MCSVEVFVYSNVAWAKKEPFQRASFTSLVNQAEQNKSFYIHWTEQRVVTERNPSPGHYHPPPISAALYQFSAVF